jgi:hypothetical protein
LHRSQIEPGWYVSRRKLYTGKHLTHFKARLDVLHGRQVARRGQASERRRQALGAQGAQARPHSVEERLQALQHVRGMAIRPTRLHAHIVNC